MGFLINLFTGGLFKSLFGTIGNIFAVWKNTEMVKYTTGVTADVSVINANVAAQVEINKLVAQNAVADKGWWVTAWMKPLLFYTIVPHPIAVVWDSMPWFGHKVGSWGVAALPGPYANLEQTIMLAVIGIVGLKGIARVFTK